MLGEPSDFNFGTFQGFLDFHLHLPAGTKLNNNLHGYPELLGCGGSNYSR